MENPKLLEYQVGDKLGLKSPALLLSLNYLNSELTEESAEKKIDKIAIKLNSSGIFFACRKTIGIFSIYVEEYDIEKSKSFVK